jgi:hypothetical protein
MNHKAIHLLLAACLLLVSAGCTRSVPTDALQQTAPVATTPDDGGATLPPNIAPLNFRILTSGDDYLTRLSNRRGDEIIVSGADVSIPVDKWHQLLAQTKGDTLFTDIYVHHSGRWMHFPRRTNFIAPDDIDPYLSYRLIEPSYVDYETITINQRNLTNFDEQVIYDNSSFSDGDKGQCVNCHSFQNWNRDGRMQMHLRQAQGGTLIVEDGSVRKVDLKTDSTLSAGVYPAWHPTQNLIAYSVNNTGQVFHTKDIQKIEVLDFGSDIVLYDVAKNRVYNVANRPDEFETFPAWSPDGRTLYYTSAHFRQQSNDIDAELDTGYVHLKYDIYCRSFDLTTHRFGPPQVVFRASALGKSAALPRISPDGRWLLFSMADYGNFHIWHRSADLYVVDLRSLRPAASGTRPTETAAHALTAANSPNTESYHSWSSNGRWIVFSSRRDDGSYTRPYICYFDRQGRAHRPFRLPQRSPDYYTRLFKSFNVPELMVRPVPVSCRELLTAARKPAQPAVFGGRLSPAEMSAPQVRSAADARTGASRQATKRASQKSPQQTRKRESVSY